MGSDIDWELDENLNWTLKFKDIEVEFLTKTQKEKLELVIECLDQKN